MGLDNSQLPVMLFIENEMEENFTVEMKTEQLRKRGRYKAI